MVIIHANQINPEIWEVWMRVLKRVDNSVLWLLKLPALAESNLKREARSHGVDPSRIIFADSFPMVCIVRMNCSHCTIGTFLLSDILRPYKSINNQLFGQSTLL